MDRDRDEGSFSARRVVAVQGGEVIFNMSASFHSRGFGPDHDVKDPVGVEDPEASPPLQLSRLFSIEARFPTQPYPGAVWPSRFWARSTVRLPGSQLLHACLRTCPTSASGLSALSDEEAAPGASLDHAIWFHRHAPLDEWVLMDMHHGTVAGGDGWYTGAITTPGGGHVARFAQETLFRPGPNPLPRGRVTRRACASEWGEANVRGP